MTPIRRTVVVALAALLLAGCLRKVPSKVPISADDSRQFADNYCNVYNSGDVDAFLALHDRTDELVRRSRAYPGTPSEKFEKLVGLGRFPRDASCKLLRVVTKDGKILPLVRIIQDNQEVRYRYLSLKRDAAGNIKVFDLDDHGLASQQNYYDAVMLDNADRTILKEMIKLNDAGEFLKVFDGYDKLSRKGQENLMCLSLRVSSARKLDRDAAATTALGIMCSSLAGNLCAIRFYEDSKQHDKELECLERIDKEVEGDPYLDVLRSHALLDAGKPDEAERAARRALEQEPKLEEAYLSLENIYLKGKQFAKLAQILDEGHNQLELDWQFVEDDPDYAEFVQSAAYQELKKRKEAK